MSKKIYKKNMCEKFYSLRTKNQNYIFGYIYTFYYRKFDVLFD